MPNPPIKLPPKDSVKLFFTLGFLGALWFAVISAIFEAPSTAETQLTSIGIVLILTTSVLFYFDRTSEHGLLTALKAILPDKKKSPHDED